MGNDVAADQPAIWVEVHTSGAALSKSGSPPFTVTLRAHTDSNDPVTIDTFDTVFDPRVALGHRGLVFRDTESGELVPRPIIEALIQASSTLTIDSPDVAEIPPKGPSESFAVSYTFRTPGSEPLRPREDLTEESSGENIEAIQAALGAEIDRLMPKLASQVESFVVGRTYEIGFGDNTSQVSWWRHGARAEVFAHGPRGRGSDMADIALKLANTAHFEVVE